MLFLLSVDAADVTREHQGSLGYVWLIPSFEASVQPTPEDPASLSFTATIESTEIDFFKRQSGIEKIEVDFVWSIH